MTDKSILEKIETIKAFSVFLDKVDYINQKLISALIVSILSFCVTLTIISLAMAKCLLSAH